MTREDFSNFIYAAERNVSLRRKLKDCRSDEEIIAYFVERYGEWILRSPPISGFNIVLWVLPGVTILIGFLWVFYKGKKGVENTTIKITELSPEEERKIMDDLGRFEKS